MENKNLDKIATSKCTNCNQLRAGVKAKGGKFRCMYCEPAMFETAARVEIDAWLNGGLETGWWGRREQMVGEIFESPRLSFKTSVY